MAQKSAGSGSFLVFSGVLVWAFLIYLPDLIRASAGFLAVSGISHTLLWRSAPSILPSSQSIRTLRCEIHHLAAASLGDMYLIRLPSCFFAKIM
jgi:hypothetical protein